MTIHRLGNEDNVFSFNGSSDPVTAVYGENGNDRIVAVGADQGGYLVSGGNGNDSIAINSRVAESITLCGGNGNDTLDISNNKYAFDNRLYGGNGVDNLDVQGWQNELQGGNGNDDLFAGGWGNVVKGGRGDDHLASRANDTWFFGDHTAGSIMYGGSGHDSFEFQGTSELHGGNTEVGVIRPGDTIYGPLDEIRDYQRCEEIAVGAWNEVDTVNVRVGPDSVYVPTQSYATLRGELVEHGVFTVDPQGCDLMLVYSSDRTHGAVVLTGWTDPQQLLIV